MEEEKALFAACTGLFEELDAAGTGTVGVEELSAWLRAKGHSFPVQAVTRFLQRHSHRGALSLAELLALQTAAGDCRKAQRQQLEDVFYALSEGSERLSVRALLDYFRSLGTEPVGWDGLAGATELDFAQFAAIFFNF